MRLPVAVGEVRVDDPPLELQDLGGVKAHQPEVRAVDVRLDGGMVDILDELRQLLDRVDDGVVERLELQRHLDAVRRSVVGELTRLLDCPVPLHLGWDHLVLPDVLAEREHEHRSPEHLAEFHGLLRAVEMELADRRVEVGEAEGSHISSPPPRSATAPA